MISFSSTVLIMFSSEREGRGGGKVDEKGKVKINLMCSSGTLGYNFKVHLFLFF